MLADIIQGKRGRAQIGLLLFHHVKGMAIEDAHEPGTKGTAAFKARQPAPGQQKCALRDLFGQHPLITEAQSSGHGNGMMLLPEPLESILVSLCRFCDQIILNGHYDFRPLFSSVDVLRKETAERFPKSDNFHHLELCLCVNTQKNIAERRWPIDSEGPFML